MTEIYGLFDAADPMDPDRVYTSEAFARLFRAMMRDGIVHNDGDELAVGPTVPAAMSVSVGTGMALIQGRYYINDGDLTLNVEAADPSHPRIDRVVVRLEATPGRTVHAVVKKGTPAPSPVPPSLTRTAETWELSLAQIRVEAGATSIVAGKITDERSNTSLCGVAAPVYVPSSQVEVVGAINMQGHALTGLPVPSAGTDAARKDMGGATLQNLGTPTAATDAATKAYVDAATAPKTSEIVADADLDLAGHDLIAAGLRAPFEPTSWTKQNVAIPWGDTSQSNLIGPQPYSFDGSAASEVYHELARVTLLNDGKFHEVKISMTSSGTGSRDIRLVVGGEEYLVCTGGTGTINSDAIWVAPGSTLVIEGRTEGYANSGTFTLIDTGRRMPPSGLAIDTSSIWLALDTETTENIPLTLTIAGSSIPLSDYLKCFPLKPTQIYYTTSGAAKTTGRPTYYRKYT